MLTNWLLSLGLTRDSFIWFWSRVVTLALLVSAGVIDYDHFGITDAWVHRITIGAAVILWLAGKYDSSPLPGKKKE